MRRGNQTAGNPHPGAIWKRSDRICATALLLVRSHRVNRGKRKKTEGKRREKKRPGRRRRGEMILVSIVAELLEEYTVLVARVLRQMLHDAPFPRRMRFLILRSLPFTPPPRSLRPLPPPYVLAVAAAR